MLRAIRDIRGAPSTLCPPEFQIIGEGTGRLAPRSRRGANLPEAVGFGEMFNGNDGHEG